MIRASEQGWNEEIKCNMKRVQRFLLSRRNRTKQTNKQTNKQTKTTPRCRSMASVRSGGCLRIGHGGPCRTLF